MKKTFCGLFSGALVAGLIAVSAPAATAVKADPYTGTVPTKTAAVAPARVKANRPVKVKVKIIDASNETPRGKITIRVVDKKTGKFVKKATFKYSPTRVRYPAGKLPKGKYRIIVRFVPAKASIFRRSSSVAITKVV